MMVTAARLSGSIAAPLRRLRGAKDLGSTGTPGFIVGTELQPGALEVSGLNDLIARAGNRK
jgi:hypothetical protein